MDKENIRKLNPERYGPLIDQIEAGICPYCGNSVNPETIQAADAKTEYEKCGMCETCFNNYGRELLKAAMSGDMQKAADVFFKRQKK